MKKINLTLANLTLKTLILNDFTIKYFLLLLTFHITKKLNFIHLLYRLFQNQVIYDL